MNLDDLRIDADNAAAFYDEIFAPWVKQQGHEVVSVAPGRVVMRLPRDEQQVHVGGVVCGQAVSSAIDTACVMAMYTQAPVPTGGTTALQVRFLRPATGDALLVDANVLKAGRRAWYAEVHVTDEASDALIAHATVEFM